ncbi:MAG TPA: nickel pincer cofactor biosynthesis protein LarC [bacterium]|nr:nickel pincer cofactor biosynthesis protein LarC [bacterium]
MKLLYLDLVGGISGDMTVAALLELGVPLEHLRGALAQVGLEGIELSTERAERHHLAGTRFLVRDVHGAVPDQGHAHDGSHGSDAHGHERGPSHAHDPGAEHGHSHPHRAYRDIRRMLEESRLPEGTRRRALAVFARLADAEGAVHGVPAEAVTFHEVGAWDSIADIVCTAAALEHLGVEEVLCSPVPTGSGSVETAHGRMPIPAPATLLLLQGFPVEQGGPAYERTTPTGAAILAALARPAPAELTYVPLRVGVGIGGKDSPAVPNLMRAVLGERGEVAPADAAETIECAEANLDDANPEWIGYLMERLLAAGALDVALIPAHMKKNRPGTLVQVLYPPALRETVQGLLFSETTTLGVRYRPLQRVALPRRKIEVATPWGVVSGVEARHAGKAYFSPEYEACRRVAEATGVPLREVYRAAQQAWYSDGSRNEDRDG